MYIKMQDNKSLIVTVPSTIYRGETGADTMTFLIPDKYKNFSISDSSVLIRYVGPDGAGHSEQLKLLPEMYNGYLQYALSVDTDVTSDDGVLTLWLSCISYDDIVVFKTGELEIEIKPSKDIGEYLTSEDLDQIDQLAIEVSNLKSSKADNLIYDADDGSLQLSASGVPIGDEVAVTGGGGGYNIIDGGGAAE